MDKQAVIDILTGRMGAGKTTLSHKLAPQYDEVVQTDFSRPMNPETGKYDEPTRAEKERIRSERRSHILKLHEQGKKVLVEGHPPGVVKLLREDLPKVDRVMVIPVTVEQSFERVAKRAKSDPKEFDFLTEMDSAVSNNQKFDHYMERIKKTGVPIVAMPEPKEKTAAPTPVPQHHSDFLDQHFTSDDRDKWRSFRAKLKDPGFVSAVKQDLRSDKKLKNFSEMIGRHDRHNLPTVTVHGATDSYKVKYHPDIDRFSCDCGDWTYKRSVKNNKKSDCKHIKLVKARAQKAGVPMQKKAFIGPLAQRAAGMYGATRQSLKNEEEAQKLKAQNQMYAQALPERPSLAKEIGFFNPLSRHFMLKEAALRGAAARALLAKQR